MCTFTTDMFYETDGLTPAWIGTDSKSIDDYVVPNFHARVRSGEIFNNPCKIIGSSYEFIDNPNLIFKMWKTSEPEIVREMTSGHFTAYCMGIRQPYQWWVNEAPVPTLDVIKQAKSKALANVDSTPYEFFEDLLEIKETLRFLRHPLKAMADVADNFSIRKRKIRNIRDANQRAVALANLWKQYRFAFAPLLRSILNGVEAFRKFEELTRPVRRNAHGYSKDSESVTHYDSPWTGGGINQKRFNYTMLNQKEVKAHAAILYEVSNPVADWQFKLGLRAKDIPNTLWQVFPLSFMYDRVLNIGDIISGLMNFADPSVTILAGSVTERTTGTIDITCTRRSNTYSYHSYIVQNPDTLRLTSFVLDRTVWSPSVGDVVPPLTPGNLVADVTSILDLIALITRRLK
jgi:hypothetical protein